MADLGVSFVARNEAVQRIRRVGGIVQDLKMSRIFLRDQLQDGVVGRVVLIAPKDVELEWKERLEQVFEMPPLAVELEHLPMIGNLSGVSVRLAATLLGAAAGEVV